MIDYHQSLKNDATKQGKFTKPKDSEDSDNDSEM